MYVELPKNANERLQKRLKELKDHLNNIENSKMLKTQARYRYISAYLHIKLLIKELEDIKNDKPNEIVVVENG